MSSELSPAAAGPIALTGRTIVVTGAARGLGRAFAEAIAAAGAACVILADRDADGGEAAAAALRATGADARFLAYDQADPASVAAFGAALARDHGAIDGLVNNAALATGVGGKPATEIELELFDRVLAINVRGLWLVTKALTPLLAASAHGGRVVNLASDTALWGAPNLLAYVASKGAVISMTRALAREMGGAGTTVNAIAPGIVLTESTEYVPAARHRLYVEGRALSRPQMPEDVTGIVVFLLSTQSGFISGQLLPVNGGFVFN